MEKDDPMEQKAVVDHVNRSYHSKESWTTECALVDGKRITLPVLREELRTFDMYLAVHKTSQAIIGCVKVGITDESITGRQNHTFGYMSMISVAAEYQSQGLGNCLVDCAEEYCKERGMKNLVRIASSPLLSATFSTAFSCPPLYLCRSLMCWMFEQILWPGISAAGLKWNQAPSMPLQSYVKTGSVCSSPQTSGCYLNSCSIDYSIQTDAVGPKGLQCINSYSHSCTLLEGNKAHITTPFHTSIPIGLPPS